MELIQDLAARRFVDIDITGPQASSGALQICLERFHGPQTRDTLGRCQARDLALLRAPPSASRAQRLPSLGTLRCVLSTSQNGLGEREADRGLVDLVRRKVVLDSAITRRVAG